MRGWCRGATVSQCRAMNSRARSGSWGSQPAPRDRVTVASEKADFIADRIASGVAAPEQELRSLARYLREVAAAMGPGSRPPRTPPPVPTTGTR
jgi:hypothetical protein